MLIARDAGEGAIDVLRTMRQIQKRIKDAGEAKKEKLHVADGIHLNDLGQTAMGYAILKGLHAPAEVSAATIDASKGDVTDKRGCDISNVTVKSNHLEFDRLDSRLPFNQGLFFALRFRFIPFPDELNRYMLTVKGLEAGKYAITVDGRGVGTFSADDLSAGVNLSSATADGWEPGGPWEAQAWTLAHLTDARNDAEQAAKMHRHYLGRVPGATDLTDPLAAANRALESAQRTAAAPRPYRFVIMPAP